MNRAVTVVGLVAAAFTSAIARGQDLPESSPRALLYHAQGVDAYVKGNNAEAVRLFVLAWQSDPTSFVSLLMAGVAAGNAGQGARADSFYAAVLPNKDKLSAYYRYRLEAQMAGRAGDIAGYNTGNRRAADLGPGTKAWYNVAQGTVIRGQAAEGREALRKLDPDKEPMKGWYSYYSVYMDAAHLIGDHEDELRMARRAQAALPGDIRPIQREAWALAALGRVAEAERAVSEARAAGTRFGVTPGNVYVNVGQELSAHGNVDAGTRMIQAGLAWYDALPADTARTVNARGDKAYALHSLGRHREAAPIYAALITDAPNTPAWKAWAGFVAAMNGDRAKAEEAARLIESRTISLTPENQLIWRGLIAAALRDRENAIRLLRESGVQAIWMHRDPTVNRLLGPSWLAQAK